MEHIPSPSTPDHTYRIPPTVWLIAAGLVAALVAIFVFKVALDTVFFFGLLGLMLFSHLFMHGGHGSHGGHGQPGGAPADKDSATDSKSNGGHTGGCH